MKKIVYISFCLTLLSGCVSQQDVIRLDNRLSRLERKSAETDKDFQTATADFDSRLKALGENREEQDLELRNQSAGLNVKVERLKEELRILNGRIEEIQHRLDMEMGAYKESGMQVGEVVSYNDDRLRRVEKYLNLEPLEKKISRAAPPPVETAPAPPAPAGKPEALSETDLYVAAKQNFDQGKYEEARQGFETMLKKYPGSNRADNAQFWIGETYYQERWYEKAILEYQKVVEKYSGGNKAPAAMLKQGFAFFNLGDKVSARLTLQELVKKYPSSNEAAVAKKKLGEM